MPGKLTTTEIRKLNRMNGTTWRTKMGDYLDMLLSGVAQIGRVFFYDATSGDDNWNGESPARAKKTAQAAIDLCVADRGDVVIKMRGGEAVTETVTFDCAGMTMIAEGYGMAPLAIGEYFSIYSTTLTADPVATVTADGVTIAGVGFAGADAGALFWDGAALLIGGLATAAPFGCRIVDCRFPKWGLDNRIGIGVEGSSDCIIEHCSFEGVGAAFGSGIYVQGATQNIEIIENRFRSCTYGILFGAFAGGGPHCVIKSNVFEDAKILSVASAATGIVCDNWSELAVGTGSFSHNYANLATYGIHCCDNHYAEAD